MNYDKNILFCQKKFQKSFKSFKKFQKFQKSFKKVSNLKNNSLIYFYLKK